MTPDSLDLRLAALEASVPATGSPPPLPGASHRVGRRLALPAALAPGLVLAIAATAVGAVAMNGLLVRGAPGVENPGQPLAGANLECMTPPEAAAYLSARGYTNVVWQVESGDASGKGGRSVQQPTAPDHGYVVPGSIVDGTLLMVVDQRDGATGTGACPDLRMP